MIAAYARRNARVASTVSKSLSRSPSRPGPAARCGAVRRVFTRRSNDVRSAPELEVHKRGGSVSRHSSFFDAVAAAASTCLRSAVPPSPLSDVMKSPRASSLLVLALVLVAVAHLGEAAVWIEKVVENPMYPRHCRDSRLRKYFPENASWFDSNSCLEKTCQFPYIRTFSCASVSVDPECTLVSDNTRNYPDCCPQPLCPGLPNDDPIFNTI